jgi:hypothetical protein
MEKRGCFVKALKDVFDVATKGEGNGKGRLGSSKGPESYHLMATAALTAL